MTGLEDEEESEEVVNQVLDEIGVDLGQAVSVLDAGCAIGWICFCAYAPQLGETPSGLQKNTESEGRVAQAIGGGDAGDDDLQARLDSLRK